MARSRSGHSRPCWDPDEQAGTDGAARREVDTSDHATGGRKAGEVPERPRGGEAPARPCSSCGLAKDLVAERARLAVWLAHELRTPLNCVLGYAELLFEQLEDRDLPPLAADAQRVRELALHQLALLEDVLDLARREHGSLLLRSEPVDAVRVLGKVAEAAFPLVRRGGNRILVASEGEAWVLADETRLRQILLNLVGNAAKFTRDGLITLGATARNGSFVLHVSDTGTGMTEEEAGKVFLPFQQANGAIAASHGGSGLGLAISKELCERMGGSISVETAVGEGTTFSVTLPAARKSSPSVD